MRLEFQMDVLAADTIGRTIEGVIAPYGEAAVPFGSGGRKVSFSRGSIQQARARTPLLVDHDRKQPIGVLASLVDTPEGAYARFKVDDTPAGDVALTQAASGSRGAFSIGAELENYVEGSAGELTVSAAAVVEVSLLAIGAYAGAAVARVAATATEPENGGDDELEDESEDESEDDETAEDGELEQETTETETTEGEQMTTESERAAPMILASRQPAPREMSAGEFVALTIRAQHGEADARRMIEAALTETISTDVTGLLPPTYERTVIGGAENPRPLYETFRSRPIPGVGLLVSKPKWTTPPNGAWAATVDADATTSKVVVGSQTADVIRWDWAGAISWVVVQRSDPAIVDEIYAEAIQDWYLDVEAKIYGELGAASAGVATKLGEAIAEFYVASGKQRTPDVIIMAPDVWGKFADTGALSVPLAQGAVGVFSTTFAGIPAIVSGTLAAGETILATRRAVDARVTEPVRLTANAIGALNVELAVVGEGLFDTDYPAELLKFAAIVPQIAEAASSSKRSSG